LEIPILIFGVAAADPAATGDGSTQIMVLGALLAVALPLCPWAAAAALRQALD